MLEAASRTGSWRLPRSVRDSIAVFFFAWLATLLPVLPYREPTLWLWGALGGACITAASWMLALLSTRRRAMWDLLGCAALIGVASFCDFSRTPPAYLLSRCRSAGDAGFARQLLNHIAMHWQWFPITNATMVIWICLGFDSAAGPAPGMNMRRRLRAQILPRLGHCVVMTLSMEMATSAMEVIDARLQNLPTADAFVCAMLCGMAFYHLMLLIQSSGADKILSRLRLWCAFNLSRLGR